MIKGEKITIPMVIEQFANYLSKDKNNVGGILHVVIDDQNVEDSTIKRCLERAKNEGDHDAEHLSNLLLKMTKTQRKKIGSKAHEWIRRKCIK